MHLWNLCGVYVCLRILYMCFYESYDGESARCIDVCLSNNVCYMMLVWVSCVWARVQHVGANKSQLLYRKRNSVTVLTCKYGSMCKVWVDRCTQVKYKGTGEHGGYRCFVLWVGVGAYVHWQHKHIHHHLSGFSQQLQPIVWVTSFHRSALYEPLVLERHIVWFYKKGQTPIVKTHLELWPQSWWSLRGGLYLIAKYGSELWPNFQVRVHLLVPRSSMFVFTPPTGS